MWHESKEIQQRDGVRLPWDTLSSYGLERRRNVGDPAHFAVSVREYGVKTYVTRPMGAWET